VGAVIAESSDRPHQDKTKYGSGNGDEGGRKNSEGQNSKAKATAKVKAVSE